jgi:integrase
MITKLPSYLTQRQVHQLFAAMSRLRDRALFAVAYAYGLRVGEIVLLDRNDIDLDRARIRIRRLKGGLSGERPIFRNLLPLLRQHLESRTDDVDALFGGLQGRLKKRRIQELFRSYATEAVLPPTDVTFTSYATPPPFTCSMRAKTSILLATTSGTARFSRR